MKKRYLALFMAVVFGTTTLSSCFWGRYHGDHDHYHDHGDRDHDHGDHDHR
jgi:hypothetical protein